MVGASTGRLSSSDPNLQNIPIRTQEGRQIRTAFVARDGYKLISADYSQIELRLVAHVAEEETMMAAFHRGVDIHAQTAAEVFNVPLETMDSETRRRAKAINFGIIYGISGFGLARQLSIPQGEARDYIKAYFERFPGIRAYMDNAKQFAKVNHYVKTLFGRRIHIPQIEDKNQAVRAFAERQAINAPIQGSAADIITVIYTIGHIVIAMTCNNLITGAPLKLAALDALIEPMINGVWYYILDKAWASKISSKSV